MSSDLLTTDQAAAIEHLRDVVADVIEKKWQAATLDVTAAKNLISSIDSLANLVFRYGCQIKLLRSEREANRDRIHELVTENRRRDRVVSGANGLGQGVWHWGGDEHDHVDSLTCPILIEAEEMRKIQNELQVLRGMP